MRNLILVCLLNVLLFSCTSQNTKDISEQPISIIFDTDIGGDYDDVGAMGMLHALADRGEIKILGVLASNLNSLVIPSIDVINTYFNRPNLPIGSPKTEGVNQGARELFWPDSLIANYPHKYKSTADAPDAVTVYRELLASQPDTSVTIVTVGFLTNLRNLLISKADSISPLSGKELIAKKVKLWVAMAGKFPKGKECNVRRDSTASQYAIDNWPGPILFSGFEIGLDIVTGLKLIKEVTLNSPIRMVYAISIPKRAYDKNGRRSWDQSALLVAARGIDPYFEIKKGKFITNKDGSNSWKDDPNGNHKYLVKKMSSDSVANEIENLMMHVPY